MPYEDVTLKTPDGLKIKAYVIPARERVIPLAELRGLESSQMKERGAVEQAAWDAVKDTTDALEVRTVRNDKLLMGSTLNLAPRSSCSTPTPVGTDRKPDLTAGNFGHRIPLARKFVSELHCNVFMLSYRGYGLSEGTPSEAGIKIDAAVSYHLGADADTRPRWSTSRRTLS